MLPAGNNKAAKTSRLLGRLQKRGLFGFTISQMEELAVALEADPVDEDYVEDMIVAVYLRHIESARSGGEVTALPALVNIFFSIITIWANLVCHG